MLQYEREARKEAQAQLRQKVLQEKINKAGYQEKTAEDFKLDGEQLAAARAKVFLAGFYRQIGRLELLFPSQFASPSDNMDSAVVVSTDNANRETRKKLVDCQSTPQGQAMGCQMTLMGQVSMCTRTFAGNAIRTEPCLAVTNELQDFGGSSGR